MTPRHFAVLAVAAAVSLAAAIATYTASVPWSQGTAGGGRLFPTLERDAARVALIEISQGPAKLALERSGEQWRIKERGGFPADPEKIRALVTGIAEANLTEPKTRSSLRHALLEVEEPSGKDANSRLIRLLDGKGAPLAEAIVGKKRAGGFGSGQGGTYVRKVGDDQAWLADTEISGGTEPRDWTKSRIFETSTDKIKKLTISQHGELPYEIVREASGNHQLTEIPAGKKIKYVNTIDGLVEASAYVDFEDVRKGEGELGGDVSTVSLETDAGLKVTYKIRRQNDTAWLRLNAEGEGEAKKAADDLMARTSGWDFKILSSKADAMLKKRDELLEDSSS